MPPCIYKRFAFRVVEAELRRAGMRSKGEQTEANKVVVSVSKILFAAQGEGKHFLAVTCGTSAKPSRRIKGSGGEPFFVIVLLMAPAI